MQQTLQRVGFLALSAILLAWVVQAGPTDRPFSPVADRAASLEYAQGEGLSPVPSQAADPDAPIVSWVDASLWYSMEDGLRRSDVLSSYGLDGAAPFFLYCNAAQQTQLELYFDGKTGAGCGFRYDWDGQAEQPQIYGFGFHMVETSSEWDVWGNTEPYTVRSIMGTDGSEFVSHYQESMTYASNGKPERFQSTGVSEGLPSEQVPVDVLTITFAYREDDSLIHKQYHHNPLLFGTTYSSSDLFFDEAERLTFADCYITHGNLESYYIYSDDSPQPAYCLVLDCDLGLCLPTMISYSI